MTQSFKEITASHSNEKARQLKENALAREKIALAREEKERQEKEDALAEVERLRALLQEKDSDSR